MLIRLFVHKSIYSFGRTFGQCNEAGLHDKLQNKRWKQNLNLVSKSGEENAARDREIKIQDDLVDNADIFNFTILVDSKQ